MKNVDGRKCALRVDDAIRSVSDQCAAISELACFGIPRFDGKRLETRSDHRVILERRPSAIVKREPARAGKTIRGR